MFVIGLFFVAQHYLVDPTVQSAKAVMLQWKQPIGATIMLVAALSVGLLHARRVGRRDRGWGYSAVTLVSMIAMIIAGMGFGIQEGSLFADWFKFLITPLESTMFSLLAFYIASAAFRAFRARSTNATILLVTSFIVILGLIPSFENSLPILGDISAFILKYPNTAAKRAILIGVALGAISVALKTIFGIDKTILGKGN
jgi:hypothetical protein